MSTKPKRNQAKKPSVFEVWKEYEAIAMHFNELLIQLRMRALGGIAVITALVSLLSKGDTETDFRWGVLSAVLLILALVWIAICIIDMKYYRRLLYGAVRAVLEVEEVSKSRNAVSGIQMSHRIKESVEGNFEGLDKNLFWKDAVLWFYATVLVSLLIGLYVSLDQHCDSILKTTYEPAHQICRILPDWTKTIAASETP